MSTFAFFLVSVLIGGLMSVCGYLGDRVMKLEKRLTYCRLRHDEAKQRADKLAEKLRYLEAF